MLIALVGAGTQEGESFLCPPLSGQHVDQIASGFGDPSLGERTEDGQGLLRLPLLGQ